MIANVNDEFARPQVEKKFPFKEYCMCCLASAQLYPINYVVRTLGIKVK